MKTIRLIMTLGALLLLAACGGGGGGGKVTPVSNTVAGVASAGIIKGGTVKVYQASTAGSATKTQIGATTQTADDGSYTVNIGTYNGPVVVEITGGTYVDEATGQSTSIPANAPMRAAVSAANGTVQVAVTPLTELAVKKALAADATLAAASIDTANAQITDLFKVDIINTKPLDASAALNGTAKEKDYTIALAGLSQLGKTTSQNLDGTLAYLAGNISNGQMTPAAATQVAKALGDFVADTTNNKTGVSTVSDNLKTAGTTTMKVTVAINGSGVGLVQTTIALPANVSVTAAANGAIGDGVVVLPTGSTIGNAGGRFTAATDTAPATVSLILPSASAPLSSGDVATLVFNVAPGATAPAVSAFTVKTDATTLFGYANGAPVSASVTLH